MPTWLRVLLAIVSGAATFGALVAAALFIRQQYYWITGGYPLHWLRARRGRGFGVAELARRVGMSETELRAFEPVYRETSIPKRRNGTRRLLVPDHRTRYLQRLLLWRVLARLLAHPAACGFEQGRSIVDNARPHVGQAVVIRLDIIDFFPSTSSARIEAYFRRIGWNAEAAALLVKLTTYEKGLPQGAPTSPRLSNLVNYRLDVLLAKTAALWNGVYTRYADDLTFSFPREVPRRMHAVVQRTRRILKVFGYMLHTNHKLRILRKHQRQQVTGLVVNEKVQLPRKTRRWLRAVRHHAVTGRPCSLTRAQLAGWNALEEMIDKQRE